MYIFIDTEAMRFVTEKELRQEFEQLKREQPEEIFEKDAKLQKELGR